MATPARPSLRVVNTHALRFDPGSGSGSYLLDQLKDDMEEDGRYIRVAPGTDLDLPPGDYRVFHARYRTIQEAEGGSEVAELYLEPSPPESTPTDEYVSLNQLKYTLERVAEECDD